MDFLKFHPRFSGNRDSGANLKKVLALVLAFACAFTMFAGAAFTDQADIKATDAVDTLVALGVVEGFEDGSFQPNATVTRAQMAKMIYVLRTGKSDASAYNDDKTSFTDIGSHWARGYIKYCQSLGIIAGKSNTIFAPNANVTAQEAAKMLLVTLGYNAEKAGLTGAGWAAKTNALADENGLLEDVNTSFTSACPRQYAAQLIYNAINAATVVWRDDAYTNMALTGTTYLPTVGEKYMGLNTAKGVVTAVDHNNKGYTMTVTTAYKANPFTDAAADKKEVTLTSIDFDPTDFVGSYVKAMYKKTDKVYGVSVDSKQTCASVVTDLGDIDLNKDEYKLDGVTFKTKATDFGAIKVVDTLGKALGDAVATLDNVTSVSKASDVALIDYDGDEKIDVAVVTPVVFGKLTYIGSSKLTVNGGVLSNVSKDDCVLYDGAAKDDYVAVVKAATVEGKLTSFKGTSKVSIDGTSYDIAMLEGTDVDSDFETSFKDQIGESYTLYTIGGIVYAAKQTSEGTKNYAIVEDTNGSQTIDSGFDPLEVKILKADGSEGKFVVHKDSTSQGTTKLTTTDVKTGVLIKYSNVSDNKIKITEVQGSTALNKDTTVYVKDTKSFNNKVAASDAVVFVNKTNAYGKPGDFYAYTIRNLNDIKAKSGAAVASILDDNKVVAAYVELTTKPSGSTADTVYGIVSKENGTVKDGDTTYTSYTVDVDTNTQKTVLIEGDSDTTLKEGYLVSFDEASDKVYSASDITIYLKNENTDYYKPSTMAAIDEYDEKGQIVSYWDKLDKIGDKSKLTTKAVDDDVKIIYVSCDDDKAADNNGAIEYDGVKGTKNAYIVFDENNDSKNVVAIFVDVDGDITK